MHIDGPPVLRPIPGTRFERVINTQALILREQGSTTYLSSTSTTAGSTPARSTGPWCQPMVIPPGIDQVAGELAEGGMVDLIDGGDAQPKPSLAHGRADDLRERDPDGAHRRSRGSPNFAAIAGTSLHWASNTATT